MKLEEPKFGPIGKEIYDRTYSRTKKDGTKETWQDTVARVVDGNLAFVDPKYHEKGERDKLFDLFYSMKILPAGRHIWATGVPGRQYLNNCNAAAFDRTNFSEHFTFLFTELLKGGGVGSNYSNRYIDIYPPLYTSVDLHIVCNSSHPNYKEFDKLVSEKFDINTRNRLVVEDSREGWNKAVEELLKFSWEGKNIPLIIDVSGLRERGAVLRSFGGTSSGPEPLVIALVEINKILSKRIGKKLTSLDIMSIDHELARAVVAGGIRRSARLACKLWSDDDIFDFIDCKKDPSKHWSANISVEIDDDFFRALRRNDKHARKVLKKIAINVHKNGEPGVFNSSLANVGEVEPVFSPNPCGEIPMSEWENCNLGHVNLDKFANDNVGAAEAFRLMTRFLIRATFGDVTNPLQRKVMDKNRRIGVGFFGYHNWLIKKGVRFSESYHNSDIKLTLDMFKSVCRKEAREFTFKLRIPECIKVTTIAPTGTISNLAGVTSGCQPIYAKYFIRRVRFSDNDASLVALSKIYPVEDSKYEKNTKIVSFYCKDPLIDECEKTKIDLSLIEEQSDISLTDHFSVQAMLQQEWADNAISYTVNFDNKKVKSKDIAKILRIHMPRLKGSTLFPEMESRPQMPMQRITREQYEEAQKKGWAMVSDGERECLNGICPIK